MGYTLKMKILTPLLLLLHPFGPTFASERMPADFARLKKVDATILQDLRYSQSHNFLGRPVKGYRSFRCVLTKKAAQALSEVQSDLKKKSLTLKVYDCYRPQRAVDDFVAWAKDLSDLKTKEEFYPRVKKELTTP